MGTGSSDDADPARKERELFEVLELTEELIRLKLALGLKMREGHFDIAAARYSSPHAGVSRTQFDMNMEAQTTLATTASRATAADEDDQEGGGGGEGGGALPSRWYRFEVVDASTTTSTTTTTGGGLHFISRAHVHEHLKV